MKGFLVSVGLLAVVLSGCAGAPTTDSPSVASESATKLQFVKKYNDAFIFQVVEGPCLKLAEYSWQLVPANGSSHEVKWGRYEENADGSGSYSTSGAPDPWCAGTMAPARAWPLTDAVRLDGYRISDSLLVYRVDIPA